MPQTLLYLPSSFHDCLYHENSIPFREHFQLYYLKIQPDLIIYPCDQLYFPSIHNIIFPASLKNPFFWNSIPYAILEILKKLVLFHLALHTLLSFQICVWSLCCFYVHALTLFLCRVIWFVMLCFLLLLYICLCVGRTGMSFCTTLSLW